MAVNLQIPVKLRTEVSTAKDVATIKVYGTIGRHPEILIGTVKGRLKELMADTGNAKWVQTPDDE